MLKRRLSLALDCIPNERVRHREHLPCAAPGVRILRARRGLRLGTGIRREGPRGAGRRKDRRGGICGIDGRDHFALARYLPDGSLDPSFGEGGVVTTAVSFGAKGRIIQGFLNRGPFALEIPPDGKLISVGASEGIEGRTIFALARFLPDGSLDRSSGMGGTVTTDFGNGGVALAVLLQPDDKVVVAGTTGIADPSRTDGEWPCEKFALALPPEWDLGPQLRCGWKGDRRPMWTPYGCSPPAGRQAHRRRTHNCW